MKIIELSAENVKRLKAVRIKPDGSIVQITGRNAQGKSSVLDAIAMALGGKDQAPTKPIRSGATKARIVCKLDDLVVTRTFTEGGGTLTVTGADGVKMPSPQAMLDKLVGKLSFDPLAFSRMDAKRQLETLRGLVGLDTTELDQKRSALYDERTEANRELKSMQAQLDAAPYHADAPESELSVADLIQQLDTANRKNQLRDALRSSIESQASAIEQKRQRIEALESELAGLREQLAACVSNIGSDKTKYEQSALVDVAPIRDQINNADRINRQVRENRQHAELEKKLDRVRTEANGLTEAIEWVDQEKQRLLTAAKFPVPGLSFSDSGVLFNGIPFEQASSAEQLRVSVAMGLAMNPELRVLLIRDGSLLDSESLALIAEMAEQADAQVWLERVSDGEQTGIVIEDGEVAAVAAVS